MAKEKKHDHDKSESAQPAKGGRNPAIILLILAVLAVGAVIGYNYLHVEQSRIYIEKSQVIAPSIALAPVSAGVIEKVFVAEGDLIKKNMIVATVGGQPIRAQVDGIAILVRNEPGAIASTANPVVTMIDPTAMHVEGRIAEDKGLAELHVGQTATFTVDAYGSKEYTGIVDSIAPTSRNTDIVFSISDKREEKEYVVKVRYDRDAYPELINGMSARLYVYT